MVIKNVSPRFKGSKSGFPVSARWHLSKRWSLAHASPKPAFVIIYVFLLAAIGFARPASANTAAHRILDDDIVRVAVHTSDAGLLSLWIPAAFDNQEAHEMIFGNPLIPPNFSTLNSRDRRIDICERVILHLCFQPQGDSLGWEGKIDLIAEAAAEVGEPLSPEVRSSVIEVLKVLENIGTLSKAGALIDKLVIAKQANAAASLQTAFGKMTDLSEAYKNNPALKAVGPLIATLKAVDLANELSTLAALYTALATDRARHRLDALRDLDPLGDASAWTAAWNRVDQSFGDISDPAGWASFVTALDEMMPQVVQTGVGMAAAFSAVAMSNPYSAVLLKVSKHAFVVYGQIYDFNYQLHYASVAASVYRALLEEPDFESGTWQELVQYVQFVFYDSLHEVLRASFLGAVWIRALITWDFGDYRFIRNYYAGKRQIVARLTRFDFIDHQRIGGTGIFDTYEDGMLIGQTIRFGERIQLAREESGLPLGLTGSVKAEISRIIEAEIEVAFRRISADGQAALYAEYKGARILLQQFPKTLREELTTYSVKLPAWLLAHNLEDLRFFVEHEFMASWGDTVSLSYWRGFTVEWARLRAAFVPRGGEALAERGSGTITRFPEAGAADTSGLWRYSSANGLSVTASGRNFTVNLADLLRDPDIDEVLQLRLTATAANYEAGTALVYLDDGIAPRRLVGSLPMGAPVAGLRRSVRMRVSSSFLADLDPTRNWTLRLEGIGTWQLHALELAADITTSGETPPVVDRHWPVHSEVTPYANQGILVEFSRPLDPTSLGGIVVQQARLDPIFQEHGAFQNHAHTATLDASGRLLMIDADEFEHGAQIRVTLPTSLSNRFGRTMEEAEIFDFTVERHAATYSHSDPVRIYEAHERMGDAWVLYETFTTSNFVIGVANTIDVDFRSRIDFTTFSLTIPDLPAYHQSMPVWNLRVANTTAYPGVPFTEVPRIVLRFPDTLDLPEDSRNLRIGSTALDIGHNRFHLSSTGPAFYDMAGSSLRIDAQPLAPGDGRAEITIADLIVYHAVLDETPPRATAATATVPDGDPIPKERPLTLQFSERLDPRRIIPQHVRINGVKKPHNPVALEYDPANNRVTVIPLEAFAPGDSLTLQVLAEGFRDTQGNGVEFASFAFTVIDDVPPMPPRGMFIDPVEGGVTLTWVPPTKDAMGYPETDTLTYHVYRMSPPAEQYLRITAEPLTENTFTDTGLTNFRDYYYRVSAIDASGNESDLSMDWKIVPAPHDPVADFPGGDYFHDVTWPRDRTMRVTGNLNFRNGARLTIEEGVTVEIMGDHTVDIDGRLEVMGLANHPVRFRSGIGGGRGAWGGVIIRNQHSAIVPLIEHLEIHHARTGLYLFRSSPEIRHLTIKDFSQYGLRLSRSAARVDNLDLADEERHRWTNTAVFIEDNSTAHLSRGLLRWHTIGVDMHNSAPVLDDFTIERTQTAAVRARRASDFTLLNSLLQFNYGNAVHIHAENQTVHIAMRFNRFLHNAGRAVAALACAANSLIFAEENHWGTNDPRDIPYLVEDQSDGSSANGLVTYRRAADASFQPLSDPSILQGSYTVPTVLTAAESPYIVSGDVHFQDRVEIEPGVEFLVNGNYEIRFSWILVANGTEAEPIRFYRNTDNPANNSWKGLVLTPGMSFIDSSVRWVEVSDAAIGVSAEVNSSSATLLTEPFRLRNLLVENCRTGVRIAGNDSGGSAPWLVDSKVFKTDIAVDLYRTNARVEGCVLEQTGVKVTTGIGVRAEPDGTVETEPHIIGNEIRKFATGVSIHGNTHARIIGNLVEGSALRAIFVERRQYTGSQSARTWPYPVIVNNRLIGSGQHALYFGERGGTYAYPVSATIDATDNWWGTADAQQVRALIFDRQNEGGNPVVNYIPLGTAPANTAFATVSPSPVTTALLPGELTLRIQYPASMDTSILPGVGYWHPQENRYAGFDFGEWETTDLPNDTLVLHSSDFIPFTLANGRHLIQIDGATAADGDMDFLYADNWFWVDIPSDPGGPDISGIQRPANVGDTTPFSVSATLSDANRGNNGVWRAVLRGGYVSPFDDLAIEGTGPGGSGDGTWTFAVPPQVGEGGQTFRFTLTAYDHTGRERTSGQQTVQIIAHDIESNRNGLPDWWLMQHFGNLNQVRSGDPNNNRVRNILEYLFGTNPTVANEAPLRGYWRFDASNANDSSAWANHATLTGGSYHEGGVLGGRFLRLATAGEVLNLGFTPAFKASPLTLMTYLRVQEMPADEGIVWDNLTDAGGFRVALTPAGALRVTTRGTEGEWSAETATGLESGQLVSPRPHPCRRRPDPLPQRRSRSQRRRHRSPHRSGHLHAHNPWQPRNAGQRPPPARRLR